MALIKRRFAKSAIGATDVTLVPSTAAPDENQPAHLPITQIVLSTNAATPPAEFWGTVTTDGQEYEVTIERVS